LNISTEQHLKLSTNISSGSNEKAGESHDNKSNEIVGTGDMAKSKFTLTLIPKAGVVKDKKAVEKETRNYQKRIDIFSTERHLSVVASELPFRCLRNLGSIIGECCLQSPQDTNLPHLAEELRNFIELNATHRRPLKAVLEKLRFDESPSGNTASTIHVYLYSTSDDRFDMVSYIPACLSKLLDLHLPQTARQISPGTVPTGSSKGKSSKRGGTT
jgi:hypothetical protein